MFDVSSECVSGCCLMLNEHSFSYIMARTSYIRRNDYHVHFVLDKHA